MKWHFQEHDGYADIDQSTAAEAFVSSNLKDLETILVRESLQNVIDARRNSADGPPRVRMTLGEVSPETASDWFDGLDEHLNMTKAGLPDAPMPDEPCRTLAIEDFGTCGLTGDYTQPYRQGEQNNFANFLYHEGLSGKAGKNLGSRGVGKIVLLMASRARTMFALTIREDDDTATPLLVGKNLLCYRANEDGQAYGPKSYFLEAWPEGAPRQPVKDRQATGQFTRDFGLSRSDEPGLSILIPYLEQNVTGDNLRRAIIAEYHYAILSGRLIVELVTSAGSETFDRHHLPETGDHALDSMIRLARWAIDQPAPELSTLPPEPAQTQRLAESLVPESLRQAINNKLDQRQPVAVRIPLHVHPKDKKPVETFFVVNMEFAEDAHERPAFIREVLPVTDVRKARAAPQIRALVVIEDEPILKLLRAAEGANHTDWTPRTDEFKKNFIGRRGEIEFVATAVSQLIDIVRGEATEPVGGIATRFFSAAMPDAEHKTKGQGKGNAKGPEPQEIPDDLQENRGASYQLIKNADGFTIKRNPAKDRPIRLTVRVAYDVLRGSPWSKSAYDPADFDFRKKRSDVQVTHTGIKLERPDPGNRLIIEPQSDDFEVVVHGFDPNRDLIVDVRDTTPRPHKSKDDQNATNGKEVSDERATDQLHETQPIDA